jgi:hypothetical protein
MKRFRAVPLALGLLLGAMAARAQIVLPLEYRHVLTNDAKLNFRSLGGVPISTTVGNPPGSNGQQPTQNESAGSFATATPRQFRGLVTLGAVGGLKQSDWIAVSNSPTLQSGTTAMNALVAEQMRLPRGAATLPGGMIVLRRATVAMPYLSRQVSFAFGQVVPPPATAENGLLLSGPNAGSYWLPEPHTTTGHTNASYYWSRHGRLVYAIQPGPMNITWVKATPFTLNNVPSYANPGGGTSFRTNGANVFLLYTQTYLVSGSSSKTPRKMYWTQKGFQGIGKPISVPAARVGAVNIVYNSNFPQTVPAEFVGIGSTSPTDGTTNAALPELRTLWYEEQQGTIYAYNAEGRVFVELLGDLRSDGQTYEQLGTEIVDVFKQPLPLDVEVELGERIIPPEGGNIEELVPEPLNQVVGPSFAFRHNRAGVGKVEYYATRETRNVNDFLVHWMEEGEAGLMWPKLFGRYSLVWPTQVEKFSLYVRPLAGTETEAQATSVIIDPENAPSIEYQDPLDQPRAKFTPDLKFYTYLSPSQPVHRTLLRYTGGENIGFERVFSWLVDNLRTTNFTSSAIVTNLSAWNGTTLVWPNELAAPRVVSATVDVGERISAPFGEAGYSQGSDYLAGYINREVGISYNPESYKDPFAVGFEAANLGSIIPVNAIPGQNRLEVWWFRPNQSNAGLNAGNTLLGFKTVHWPSAVGRYTIQWPSNAREIVLASKLGGTGLTTAEQTGLIYFQNLKGAIGYNPNEEHAIMSGGTPFATRDDLNITTQTNNEYSSHPYVLVTYRGNDGRPSMAAFEVLREKPEEGYVFDYIEPAGRILQPPPPLTFLQKPVEGSGDNAVNYNSEPPASGGDLPVGWTADDANGVYGHYQTFTYRDRKNDFWIYRGLHSGLPALQAGTYNANNNSFSPIPNPTRAQTNQPFSLTVHVSRQDEYMALDVPEIPSWLSVNGLTVFGTPPSNLVDQDVNLQLIVRDLVDLTRVTNTTVLQIRGTGGIIQQAGLSLVSSNSYTGSLITYTNRPPFLAGNPAPTNSFTLRYYYKTEPSFAWPGITTPPAVGSIVPYLRKKDANGNYVGAPDSKNTASLDIVYRPVWPVRDPKDSSKPLPTLPYGATLAKPGFNLPGVRDFKTAHVLYQQSIAGNLPSARKSIVLHDPTRAKFSDVKAHFETGKIPASVFTTLYQGRYYFPNLPPHLAERVYLDPNRGEKGQLVLIGQFKNEDLGESYLHLNVLRGSDLQAVKDLCPTSDQSSRGDWESFVGDLSTDVETFHENPDVPGTYIPDVSLTEVVSVGALAEVKNDNVAADSYAISAVGPGQGYVTVLEASGTAFTKPGDPVAMHIFKVGGSLYPGQLKVLPSANPLSELLTLQHTGDFAGRFDEYEFEWRIAAPVDGLPPATPAGYLSLVTSTNTPRYTLGGAGIQALSDNYVIMRYRPINPSHPLYKANPTEADWSAWTDKPPALAEGWIKRVLAGINPFNQRVTDLFNNQVNTDVSILTQAGRRWEGDVALNLDTINNYGLVEIYETVLRRGRSLSIESGYNYGPANDALLLAAGYLSDLYMFLGNEAAADSSNPTIGIGTADRQYGDIATALFSFKGQVPTVLEEELALLRGRDDFLLPGVQVSPVYNRLVWNYTRGIDSGEVIYALNYNVQEKPDSAPDGVINASDAARMFPQGHGDAYGHYLTAIKGYYSLLLNSKFDWVPRIEAVNVLGTPVSVDYTDERKFAAAASAVAKAGRQVFDLVWRQNYQAVHASGWSEFGATRENSRRAYVNIDGGTNNTTRYWGADHWATRVGQGSYLNWVVGNALLPEIDPIPTHEGIQKVDRMTVPELRELTIQASGLQTALDNAEGGLSPLGIPEGGLVFDVNPNFIVGVPEGTHFEQIYGRALKALNNAVVSFDDAKNVTSLMRSEQDSLVELQASILGQEQSYTNTLIELYGTPYPDDIGPGKTYKQGYRGPDLLHYSFVDLPEYDIPEMWSYSNTTSWEFAIRDVPAGWADSPDFTSINLPILKVGDNGNTSTAARNGVVLQVEGTGPLKRTNFVFSIDIGPHGFGDKPKDWAGKRLSPGEIQQAISDVIAAHGRLRHEINDTYGDIGVIDKAIQVFEAGVKDYKDVRDIKEDLFIADQVLEKTKFANDLLQKGLDSVKEDVEKVAGFVGKAIPSNFIAGLAAGGDLTSAARSALESGGFAVKKTFDVIGFIRYAVVNALELGVNTTKSFKEFYDIEKIQHSTELRNAVQDLVNQLGNAQERWWAVNERVREYDNAQRRLQQLLAEGDRIQAERELFRRRSAALVQGYRTRDAAFRLFRNEKLERYKTMFDLSARYALLAANAFDYETGLLGTKAGRDFKGRIIASRALGVVADGVPQFAGSETGDAGLSGALAEMRADWDVLRGRLGFNTPDAYSTTVSFRTEKERILPSSDGDTNWKDVLNAARVPDILSDPDVRRYCMQVNNGDGLPVPGIILSFKTTISEGMNLFGQPLVAGDHAYSPSSYATKLYGVGVAFEGYRGMGDPEPSDGATGGAGAGEPSAWFLDPEALAATPYVYLIPVGVDSMRSPPLGDVSTIRTWNVEDLAIPMPFNIGGSEFSTRKLYQSSDSLKEDLFSIRKHQAFRPISDAGLFELVFYSDSMPRFEYVNNRLIGRSVWNSHWKLVIPGRTLLADPNEGLSRFIRTVKDIKLHFQTYSYSGN